MDGTPESVPMYPYEIATRLSDLGRLDYSAQPVMESTRDDLDPLERDRLRKIIASYQSSDRNLWSFRMRTWRNRCALLCRSMVS